MISKKWDSENAIQLDNVYIRPRFTLWERGRNSRGTFVTAYVAKFNQNAYAQGWREFTFTHRVQEKIITFCFENCKYYEHDRKFRLDVNDVVDVEVLKIEDAQ